MSRLSYTTMPKTHCAPTRPPQNGCNDSSRFSLLLFFRLANAFSAFPIFDTIHFDSQRSGDHPEAQSLFRNTFSIRGLSSSTLQCVLILFSPVSCGLKGRGWTAFVMTAAGRTISDAGAGRSSTEEASAPRLSPMSTTT